MENKSFKVLNLSLKSHWFDEVQSGRKKKEYRDARNLYFTNKLLRVGDYVGMTAEQIRDGVKSGKLAIKAVPFSHVRFHCGNRMMLVEFKGLTIQGDTWVIELGKVIDNNSYAG